MKLEHDHRVLLAAKHLRVSADANRRQTDRLRDRMEPHILRRIATGRNSDGCLNRAGAGSGNLSNSVERYAKSIALEAVQVRCSALSATTTRSA